MSLLGIDIGTTGCKSVAFDVEGKVLAEAYREYPLIHPEPDWAELDPEYVWSCVKDILRTVAIKTKRDPIRAIAVSAQGEAVIPIDKNGRTLYNAIVSFDKRTIPQAEWWEKNIGKGKIFQITGMPLHPMYTINKIMWFKQNKKDIFRKTKKFLCFEDFIYHKFGVEPTIDYSLASKTMAFDVHDKKWSDKILKFAEIDISLLPGVSPSGRPVDKINSKCASDLHLSNNVLIVTGGHDAPCAALGAGAIYPGESIVVTGTSESVTPTVDNLILSKKMLEFNYACYPHVVENRYFAISFNLTGGLLLRWFVNQLGDKEKQEARKRNRSPYEVLTEIASKCETDVFILPHFVGSGTPYLDSNSKGAILGLTLSTSRNSIIRALFDSLTYEMKFNIESLEKAGVKINQLYAVGGGAKSSWWLQLKADITGRNVLVPRVSEASCLGTAMLAGIGLGIFPDTIKSVKEMVKVTRTYHPRASRDFRERYNRKYEIYKKIYPAIKEINHMII